MSDLDTDNHIISPPCPPSSLAAHETFLTSLAGLSQQLSKTTRLKQITKQEVEGYQAQAKEIGKHLTLPCSSDRSLARQDLTES